MQMFSTGLSTNRLPLEKEGDGVGMVDRIEAKARSWLHRFQRLWRLEPAGRWQAAGSGPKRLDRPATIDDWCGAVLGIKQSKVWIDAKSLVDGGGEIFRRNGCIDRVGGIGV